MVLHEVLLSLSGHTGDVIIKKEVRDKITGFEVADDVVFLSKSEKQAINRICVLGFYYSAIGEFIQTNNRMGVTSLGIANDDEVVGLYARALCVGLEEVLEGYRACLLDLEQQILGNPSSHFPLTKLAVALKYYAVILPPLGKLVEEVSEATDGPGLGLHGGQILDLLYLRSLTGIPAVQHTFQRLLWHGHKILYNQISAWLVHGLLTDPYNEFFIQRVRGSVSGDSLPSNSTAEEESAAAVAAGGEAGGEGGGASGGGGGGGGGGESTFTFRQNIILQERDWNAEYSLRISMLPLSYIPIALANKILFIGRAVCLLQHPSVSKEGLVSASAQLEFSKALHHLRELSLFDLREVDIVIEQIRTVITRLLWELVVQKADLKGNLQCIKDYILFARGEFYQTFLEDAALMMSLPPGPKAARDILQGPFLNAASKVYIDDNSHFKRLSFHMDKSSFSYPIFTPNDFPKSIGRGVVCVGRSHLQGQHVQLTGHVPSQTGAMWCSPRPVLGRGFLTQFVFQSVAPAQSIVVSRTPKEGLRDGAGDLQGHREGFALILQNNSMQVRVGRAANARVGSGQYLRASFEGIDNCLAIEFTVHHSPVFKEERHSVAAYAHSVTGPPQDRKRTITPLASYMCPYPFFDGSKKNVKVEYQADNETLEVWVQPAAKPVLIVQNLNLRKIVPLEGGRCWVGFSGATDDDTRHKSHAINILSWEMVESKAGSADDWKELRMEYSVEPPLDLVLLKEGFDRYNALWRFLLDVKRTQLALHQAWEPFKAFRNMTETERRAVVNTLGLRSRMQFLVDNIQFYMQVDVIEVQYQLLLNKIDESRDFEAVREAHEDFIAALTSWCFIKDRVIYGALSECLDTAKSFCRAVTDACKDESRSRVNLTNINISSFSNDFEKQATALFSTLSRMTSLSQELHLTQLLMRIDYNGFYSDLAHKMGLKQAHLTGKVATPAPSP